MSQFSHLFSPIRIGGMEVKNRIAMMPMGVFSPRLTNWDGSYTKDGADYYIARAKGGTGMIVTGVIPIVELHPGPCAVNDPASYTEHQKYLAEGIHQYDSRVVVQLTAMTGRAGHGGNEPAPCEIQNVWDPTVKNPALSKDDIHRYVDNFAEAAYAAKRAGVDAVEIHAVHEGYLLDQFTIAAMNHRTDEYGGSLENRLRFPTEIVRAIKARCGGEFPVLVRYSVRSYMKGFNRGALPGETFTEFGRGLEESRLVARMLQDAGYDALDCDNGSYDSWFWPHPPTYMPKACNLEDVAEIKKVVDIPVICAGRFDDPVLADSAISDGRIDMMGMGRPLLADPDAANKFAENRLEDVRPCISCHQGCLARIFQGKDISCALNPACGREESYAVVPAEKKKKVLVIGGGIGGMEAARVCALRGHQVDLYERTGELGGVFVAAASPDFKDDDKRLLKWYQKQMVDLRIGLHMNQEADSALAAGYDEVFVATGAKERRLEIPGLEGSRVTYAIDALRNEAQIEGDRILIVGGGLTGCEIAYELARKGKEVTIVEMTETILNSFGLSAANYNMLMELLEHYHVRVLKNAVVQSYENGMATVIETIKNYPNIANRAKLMFAVGPQGIPHKLEIPADHIVVSVGYISEDSLYQELKGEHVHLIGDACRPANVMEAIWGAYETALHL